MRGERRAIDAQPFMPILVLDTAADEITGRSGAT
jgi:hypothetical protein